MPPAIDLPCVWCVVRERRRCRKGEGSRSGGCYVKHEDLASCCLSVTISMDGMDGSDEYQRSGYILKLGFSNGPSWARYAPTLSNLEFLSSSTEATRLLCSLPSLRFSRQDLAQELHTTLTSHSNSFTTATLPSTSSHPLRKSPLTSWGDLAE